MPRKSKESADQPDVQGEVESAVEAEILSEAPEVAPPVESEPSVTLLAKMQDILASLTGPLNAEESSKLETFINNCGAELRSREPSAEESSALDALIAKHNRLMPK